METVIRKEIYGFMMQKVLTIAGSDCSGGAGIQADLKTIMAHGAYGMSVITALTAQNTTGVFAVHPVEASFLTAQLDAVFSDLEPDAVKIGMISNVDAILAVSGRLQHYHAKNIVIDPVMVATSGAALTSLDVLQEAGKELFACAALLTPNMQEAQALSSVTIKDRDSMQEAAYVIAQKYGCAVLCKGGHQQDTADDVLYDKGTYYWFEGKHVDNPNTHGTGCTLSSAIACNLADGLRLSDAVRRAKDYLTGAILDGLDLGHGRGPLNHGYLWNAV